MKVYELIEALNKYPQDSLVGFRLIKTDGGKRLKTTTYYGNEMTVTKSKDSDIYDCTILNIHA